MNGDGERRLRLLLVEDSADDEALLVQHLAYSGYRVDHVRVDTAAGLGLALRREWDVIISDFSMAGFDAPQALEIVRTLGIDTPFIVLSGSVSEEAAVAAMKGGAHDYLVKGNLARLGSAIEREVREAAIRNERRRMREQLEVSDRLASIGMLAAGVAHEINSPLAAIVANLELLSLDLSAPRDERERSFAESVSDTLEATGHLRQIVKDLGVLSRGTERSERATVNVERVLDTAMRMAWSQIRTRARLVKTLAGVPPIVGDESRLAQVFLNLLVNASHAIEPGHASANEIRAATSFDTSSSRVVVEVSDTGTGIAPQSLDRIFDPFYTTKPAGSGTGLGLAISQRIVTGLGGTIEVDSTVGKGTTFRVLLPQAEI
jgi:signal transduction histidine kinase